MEVMAVEFFQDEVNRQVARLVDNYTFVEILRALQDLSYKKAEALDRAGNDLARVWKKRGDALDRVIRCG